MRSASPLIAGSLVAVVALTGCATTQQRSARAKLQATRQLASRRPVQVTTPDSSVRVGRVTLLRRHGAAAVVVELHNLSPVALTDLPISVGVRRGRHRTLLNRGVGLNYFESHVAALAPHGDGTWVFTVPRLRHAGGRPFAVVGQPTRPAISSASRLPRLEATAVPGAHGTLRVRLRNPSGVPQLGLQVYALARRGARYVAAGRASVAQLEPGQSRTLGIALIGSARGAHVSLLAPPTIFD